MATKPRSSESTTLLGRITIWITGLVLIGMYVAFGRLVAGSWREFGALAVAAATYLVPMILLERVVRPRTAEKWRRVSPLFPFVGALAGGAYVVASTATGIRPAIIGFAWGLLHAWLVWRQARMVAAETPAESPRATA